MHSSERTLIQEYDHAINLHLNPGRKTLLKYPQTETGLPDDICHIDANRDVTGREGRL